MSEFFYQIVTFFRENKINSKLEMNAVDPTRFISRCAKVLFVFFRQLEKGLAESFLCSSEDKTHFHHTDINR